MSKQLESKTSKSDTLRSRGSDGEPSVHSSPEPLTNRLKELNLNELVVEIRNLRFTYDKKNGYLLDNINLTFPKSAIYGFLGPSGCGKTTLIKLIVGRLTPTSGRIRVNGKLVSHPSNKIPGAGIGYMPQDISLYNEMTIYETLNYFSRIYGLSKEYRRKRIEFLIEFLDLPDMNRLVEVLSGGQKRRTSLAVAIIHSPPILMLDEPTVGVDPMLRERVWKHLIHLSSVEKTSILITTHYIEECRRAHIIALMRGGKILVENSPSTLLSHFKTDHLEDVFLRVCKFDERPHSLSMPPNISKERASKPMLSNGKANSSKVPSNSTFAKRFCALSQKNLIKLWRQKLMLVIVMLLPMLTMALVCICLGKKPYDLDIAVYNQELENKNDSKLSEKLLDKINKKTINLKPYPTNNSALDSVRDGKTYGALIITKNFTTALAIKYQSKDYVISDNDLKESTIQFYGDLTDLLIYQVLFQTLMEAELAFQRQMITQKGNNTNPRALSPLVEFVDPPVYGSLNPRFIDFGTPGVIVCIAFAIAMALTSINIVMERKNGQLDRSVIAGANALEILLSELMIQHIVCVFQIISVLTVVLLIFDVTNEGNLLLVFILALIQGTCGMSFGLFISSIADSEESALMLIIGSFAPYLVISGIIWPLEGMHYILRIISMFTPQTLPVMAIRNIMLKGWGLNHTLVWAGFMSTILYIIVFLIIATIFTSQRNE